MTTKIELVKRGPFRFEASNEQGNSAFMDAAVEAGGEGKGVRPMEMLLMGLAGCTSYDVLSILQKQRQHLEDLSISIEAERATEFPKVYTEIKLIYKAKGNINLEKLEKAVQLSMDKYCSASAMLGKTSKITFECVLSQ